MNTILKSCKFLCLLCVDFLKKNYKNKSIVGELLETGILFAARITAIPFDLFLRIVAKKENQTN